MTPPAPPILATLVPGATAPPLLPSQRKRHREMLWIASIVLVLSFLLRVEGTRVAFSIWPSHPIPELCGLRAWTGYSCPGCGLTRSFIHLAHGRLAESYRCHRLGWVLALFVLLQFPYRIRCLTRGQFFSARQTLWISRALIASLILNWIVQIL